MRKKFNDKKGVLQLLNPANYIFLISTALVLILFIFWANSMNAQQSNVINPETAALYANDISEQIYSYKLPLEHRRMSAIKSICRRIEISEYEDSFFLRKHCTDGRTFYINVQQIMIDNLKQELENQNFNREYISYVRSNKNNRCSEYREIDSSGDGVLRNIEIEQNFEISNAMFVLPGPSLYSICSNPPVPRRT